MARRKKQTLGVISDLHGNYSKHLQYVKMYEYTVQLGDLGFNYNYLAGIDPNKHKFIGGNHDNYTVLCRYQPPPHYLGDFGTCKLGETDFFFIRGAWSIDREYRTETVDWWPEEELTYARLLDAIDLYKEVKPEIVFSHDCPQSMVSYVSDPMMLLDFGHNIDHKTTTQMAMQTMLEVHQPRFWYFGHYHRHQQFQVGRTSFYCIGIDQAVDAPNFLKNGDSHASNFLQ